MQAFSLTRYRPADLDAALALFARSVHGLAARDYDAQQLAAWAPANPDRQAWAKRFASGDTLLAWTAATPVDAAQVSPDLAGFARLADPGLIDLLYVDPRYGRCGVGRILLEALISTAREGGVSVLQTEASITARPFFAALGFDVEEEQTVWRGAISLTNYRMRMSL